MTTTRVGTRDYARLEQLIGARKPFRTSGALRGVLEAEGTGQLDRTLAHALALDAADFVVYSYRTPIAWHLPAGWVVPDVYYSPTTSRHQAAVRRSI